ncbi:hypothetical protein [Sphingomonas sp.]|jgi:hypothetical protein
MMTVQPPPTVDLMPGSFARGLVGSLLIGMTAWAGLIALFL